MIEKTKKPEMKSWLKVLYTLFLAILIAFFYGLGVSAFYTAPKEPVFPIETEKVESTPLTVEQKAKQSQYEIEMRKYQEDIKGYNKNASVINLVLAVLSLVISFLFVHQIFLISDSLLLGGIFTLAYSIILGMTTEDPKYRFIVVSVGLAVTLIVGYFKFIKQKLEEK